MKAITFPARGDVRFGDVPDPDPAAGEVVVAVKASGICHTDFEVLSANYGTGAFPVIPGHEYAGIVVAVGDGVDTVAIGDRVAVDPNVECGTCRACRRGWAHLCEDLRAYGVTRNGGFAEYGVVRAAALHPVGDLPFELAALAEPMGCVLNGVDAIFDPLSETALIFGAGPMGLMMAFALRKRGVADIALVDIDERRLQTVQDVGFRALASGSGDLDGLRRSVDVVVDATGIAAVAGDLTDYMANGGKGLYFGVCPASARIEVSPFEIFRRQLTLAGSHSLNHNIPDALEVIRTSGPDLARIVSHALPLEDVATIFGSRPPNGSLKVQAAMD